MHIFADKVSIHCKKKDKEEKKCQVMCEMINAISTLSTVMVLPSADVKVASVSMSI
jgi:hypothetical protein